ncbi:ROK family protein [Acidiferrimicrobium sp. IK]|nr:ROK family protein [Acidiferrimicrobium sp. IK]MCU4182977.1 ROK family protein [Acidiferrimicrobium sp. IK]
MGRQGFGVDIGGSGIKGAVVDLDEGTLVGDRFKVATPQPSTPEAISAVVASVVDHFGWDGPFGATFPGAVTSGVVRTAANVDPGWVGADIEDLFTKVTGQAVIALNDADAAGVAEVTFGAAKGRDGLVVISTLGTGIGTALIHRGVLVPNCELGHLEIDGRDAETKASAAAREREGMSWERWARHLDRYYQTVENLLWPDLFVIGGGVSRKADKFLPLLHLRTPVVAATLRNEAGIVGAALLAAAAAQTEAATGRADTTVDDVGVDDAGVDDVGVDEDPRPG